LADDDISTLYNDRSSIYSSLIGDWDDLVMVYHGVLPSEFDDFFHEEMHRHVINMIRLSWDDLSAMAGKVFPIYVDPDNDTAKAKGRAEKQEQIGYGYNEAGKIVGGIEMPMLMKILAWWMVGVGEAVPMVLPNYEHHTPFFTFRDPRTYYPPVGWTPFTQAPADDALFVTQMSLGEVKRRYPDRATELEQKLGKTISSRVALTATTDSSVVLVGEYYHAETWLTQTISPATVNLDRHDHDMPDFPGVVPVEPMGLYSAAARPRSMFSDQVSLQAAMARMFSQKLDFYDRTLYPLIFTAPLAQKAVQVGPWAINEFDPTFQGQFKVEVVGPTNAIDADQSMAFVMGMQRMLNRNPESFQGQAPGGRAESAKAINSLRDAVANTTIRDMLWPPMLHALPKLYGKAARMDLNLWPNEKKKASGRSKNSEFRIEYRPKVDLEGREDNFLIEPGVGLGGYQGTLEIIQLVGAELMDDQTALEQLEDVRDATEAKRRIDAMRLEKIELADLNARALAPPGTPGKLQPDAIAKLRKLVQSSGKDLFDAIEELGARGELVEEPAPPMLPGMPGAGGPPGAPPAGMVPPLELLRGGRG
jgi:hypothetical protein